MLTTGASSKQRCLQLLRLHAALPPPIHHGSTRHISFFGWLREIREEFKENDQASQPMDNQPWEEKEATYEPTLREKVFQSPLVHWAALRASIDLYKLGWTNQHDAVAILHRREEALKRDKDKYSGREQSAKENVDKAATKLTAIETDLMKVTERVRALMPDRLPLDKDGVVKVVKAQEGNIKELAVDRLEVMGASISEFMSGYREGKVEGVAHINSPEGDKYFASFDVMSRTEEEEEEKEDKQPAVDKEGSKRGQKSPQARHDASVEHPEKPLGSMQGAREGQTRT